MHRFLARRLAALVLTTLIALSVGHVIFNAGLDQMSWGEAFKDAPGHLRDIAGGEFGATRGGKCAPPQIGHIELCTSYSPGEVGTMLRDRLPIDLQLMLGGLILGTGLGVAAGRWCAVYPGTAVTRAIHAVTACLQSCPPYFLAFAVLILFSWSTGTYKIPFVSGQGDYRPFGQDPLQFIKAMWVPWIVSALPLAAYVARIAEISVIESLQEDFIRTARAKGLPLRRVLNRHALPVATPPIAAMTGVNVSTLLINVAAIEYGFSLPGMFSLIRGAIVNQDVAVLEALVLEGVILVTVANFLVDALQARMDPRIRSAERGV